MEITKEILKDSPLFNLSLTNKELFHSNFIAWFGKLYPYMFIDLMNRLLGSDKWAKGMNPDKMVIRREFKNFDISVFDNNDLKNTKPRLIIENKVKSVPTREQLQEYEGKIDNDKNVALLLLTMNEQLHTSTDNENQTRWKVVNYTRLSNCLEDIATNLESPYHKLLVEDYCKYVRCLETMINIYSTSEAFLCTTDEYKAQEELGLHDVCGKRKVQYAYSLLVKQLQQEQINVVKEISKLNCCSNEVQVAWAYTNAPLIEVRLKTSLKTDEYILIQVQGKQYRHCVEFFDKSVGKRIKKIDKKNFGPSDAGLQFLRENYRNVLFGECASANYPTFEGKPKVFGQRRKGGEEGYCKYCNGMPSLYNGLVSCFVYQWIELPDQISIPDLIEAVVADTMKLLNLYNNK